MIENSKGKMVNPAVFEHMAMENARLREVLRCIADLPMDRCSTENDYRLSAAKAIALGALSQQPEPECRDWVEDLEHENGNYSCRCCQCGEQFAGHKRRVVCKVCDSKVEPVDPAPAQDELEPFKRWAEVEYNVNPNTEELNLSHIEVKASLKGWQGRAARPAQTEQQPVSWTSLDKLKEVNDVGVASMWAERVADDTDVALYAAPIAQTAPQSEQSGKFAMHQRVRKTSGSEWHGRICGTYSTSLTPEGYAVESEAHAGSVQIYPAKALEAVR